MFPSAYLSEEPVRKLIFCLFSPQIELDLHKKHVINSWETQTEEKKQVWCDWEQSHVLWRETVSVSLDLFLVFNVNDTSPGTGCFSLSVTHVKTQCCSYTYQNPIISGDRITPGDQG